MKSAFRWRYLGPGRGVLVSGWVFSPDAPSSRHVVEFNLQDEQGIRVLADQYRGDLEALGFGDGRFGFRFVLNVELLDGASYLLGVKEVGSGLPLVGSPALVSLEQGLKIAELKIDPGNIDSVSEVLSGAEIDSLLIDTNDTCNADCVYCPNLRSRSLIGLEEFENFLSSCLKSARYVQFGCGQEPMLDPRLPTFMSALRNSSVSVEKISMITNASLLRRFDMSALVREGLSELQVSIDTVDPVINSATREGTDIHLIMSDLKRLVHECFGLELVFSVTVNAMSIHSLEDLLDFGQSLSVKNYYVREVFDRMDAVSPKRRSDYDEWMSKLVLRPGEFELLQQRIKRHAEFGKIYFVSSKYSDLSANQSPNAPNPSVSFP